VYDITNVLEGIGLIEKQTKNKIKWTGVSKFGLSTATEVRARPPAAPPTASESGDAGGAPEQPLSVSVAAMPDDAELRALLNEEARLDADINMLEQSLREMADNPLNAQLGFVTYDDIRTLPRLRGETIMAIKAPPGTRLRVPDPDEGMPRGQRRYELFLKSENEQPIDVFLVSDERAVDSEIVRRHRSTDANAAQVAASSQQSQQSQPMAVDDASNSAAASAAAAATTTTAVPSEYMLSGMAANEGLTDLFV
jgi:transcription factor E2F3